MFTHFALLFSENEVGFSPARGPVWASSCDIRVIISSKSQKIYVSLCCPDTVISLNGRHSSLTTEIITKKLKPIFPNWTHSFHTPGGCVSNKRKMDDGWRYLDGHFIGRHIEFDWTWLQDGGELLQVYRWSAHESHFLFCPGLLHHKKRTSQT